ncbi:MAG: protein phosphatase CheZ [Betaproteobacteria bacterium]|nr:protein phosphatase CheZ [Betaproteobacteria bacterium]
METASSHADNDTPELEALFESIVAAKEDPGAKPAAPALPRTVPAKSRARIKSPVVAVAPAPVAKAKPNGAAESPPEDGGRDMIERIGHMTRQLHDTLRELGYDSLVEQAASAIPDACDRLAYVAHLTEQAANRALSATEKAKPLQEEMERDATRLHADWERVFANQMTPEQFKEVAERTRAYLKGVPAKTQATNSELMEIMMAQDFQDLTGQVIKKITDLAKSLEDQLVALLIEHAVPLKRADAGEGMLNGPVINGEGRDDVVTDQTQVDNLLESLGF